MAQWEAYVAAMRTHGWQTVEVEPAQECPDSVFVEDTMVVYGTAVIARPGADSRKPETPDAEKAVSALGYSRRTGSRRQGPSTAATS